MKKLFMAIILAGSASTAQATLCIPSMSVKEATARYEQAVQVETNLIQERYTFAFDVLEAKRHTAATTRAQRIMDVGSSDNSAEELNAIEAEYMAACDQAASEYTADVEAAKAAYDAGVAAAVDAYNRALCRTN